MLQILFIAAMIIIITSQILLRHVKCKLYHHLVTVYGFEISKTVSVVCVLYEFYHLKNLYRASSFANGRCVLISVCQRSLWGWGWSSVLD